MTRSRFAALTWKGTRRAANRSLLVVLAVVAAACREGGTAADWAGRVDTLASRVIRTRNPGAGLWDSTSAWRVREDLRLGATEGSGPNVFGAIRGLAVSANGTIYVLDGLAREVRVFERSGAPLRTVGRRGRGPGEIEAGIAIELDSTGHLWIVDPGNGRLTQLDGAGTPVSSHPMPAGFFLAQWGGGFDTAGRFFGHEPDRRRPGFGDYMLVAYDASMRAVDTVTPPGIGQNTTFDYVSPDGRSRISADVPFTPVRRWRFDRRGYLWVCRTDDYRLVQLTLEGDTVRIIERTADPVPVTAEDRDSALAQLAWFTAEGGRLDPSRVPTRQPPVEDFFIARSGHLWVLPAGPWAARRRVADVFDPDGRYLGRVELPFAFMEFGPEPTITEHFIHAVVANELGVQSVVRATVIPGM